MSKEEARSAKRSGGSAAGNAAYELTELEKLQRSGVDSDILTITVTCSEVLTILCC